MQPGPTVTGQGDLVQPRAADSICVEEKQNPGVLAILRAHFSQMTRRRALPVNQSDAAEA